MDYYNYLINNNYQVCLNDASDYIEGFVGKDYYTLDEIKALEPTIAHGLRIINNGKAQYKK